MPSGKPTSDTTSPRATRRHPHLAFPASLRRPPAARQASNPKLSVIFADPSLSSGAAPSRPGTLASEDALARQMNAGGQDMGLRSRRSSSATVQTMRTSSGLASPTVEEEPEAGPSSPRGYMLDETSERASHAGVGRGAPAQRLNPKHSTSWLRWNQPSGFPRSRTGSIASRNQGKGKEKEGEPTSAADYTSEPDCMPAEPADTVFQSAHPDVPPSTSFDPTMPDPSPPKVPPPPPEATPRPPRSMRNNWWSRTASPAPSARPPDPAVSPIPGSLPEVRTDPASTVPALLAETPVIVEQPGPVPAPALPAEISPTFAGTTGPAVDNAPPPVPSSDSTIRAKPPVPPSASGWRSYIWGNPAAPPLPSGEPTSDDNTVPLLSDTAMGESVSNEPPSPTFAAPLDPPPSAAQTLDQPTFTTDPDPALIESSPNDTGPPSTHNQGSGWGTFLFSLVVPQIAVSRTLDSSSPPSHPGAYPTESIAPAAAEIAISPAEDQRPEPTVIPGLPNTSPSSAHSAAMSPPDGMPEPVSTALGTAPTPPSAKPPAASTAGWLSYLAYRSTQKRLPGGSVRSATSAQGRTSSELGEEEVMDLSSDPDFPATVPDQAIGKKGDIAQKLDKGIMPPPKTIPAKTSSSALTVRDQRQSMSSVRSGGTITPLASSPRTGAMAESKSAISPKPSTGSTLAIPPAVPAHPPNLVIPTFDNTFDRPPRSFLPLAPPKPTPVTGAASGGLAWRALSAAGSYVYPSAPVAGEKGKKGNEGGDEAEREARGRKEGRGVGADLPRRLGLDGGDKDEGWRSVRRVVVVGVHGWFPAKMLNSVIGEPTGTSQKFANMMGAAVKQFFADQGMEDEIRLTLMPLEGDGTIDTRVDKLYKAYLSNPAWINDLRRADAIFFAAHSQGCIVTTHLLSRMIAQGHIRTPLNAESVARCEWAFGPIGVVPSPISRRSPASRTSGLPGSEGGYQKVCMLAMCGVHLGPLYSISTSSVIQPYLQWFENAAARELFEFQESGSAVSGAYQKALGMVLENGVKVVLLASMNDQVVPIYGASFSTATHPLLLRALFVDGATYSQTDFMTNLLSFAFMLRNAGLDDQRLIEHLSEATAGSLTGIGHSSPYEEPQSYALAVKYLFLSGPCLPSPSTSSTASPVGASGSTGLRTSPIPPLRIEPFSARDTRNEYELPWIMRALVDSPEIKDLFPGELKELKEGIGAWRPVTKVLKEVKKRLEPMAGRQSKLRPIPNSPSSASVNTLGSVGSGSKEATLGVGLKRDW